MNKFSLYLGLILITFFITTGCDNVVDNNGNAELQSSEIELADKKPTPTSTTCQTAGTTGQTALYANQSVNGATVNFSSHSCDMGIYFDENAPKNAFVQNTTIINEMAGGGDVIGIWNNGGDVTISNSTFSTDFAGQFVPIQFDDGASGTIAKNEINGTHRSAIVIRGEGTNADIKGNSIVGSGAKVSGWAENGIQVDQGASASIKNNELTGHWWDGESNFASTGILLYGASQSEVTNNKLYNNEYAIYLAGDANKVSGNQTSSDIISESSLEFQAYGALVAGSENHLAGNSFSAENGAVGIYIFPGVESNDVTGNRIQGFVSPIVDGGTDSKVRGTPAPPNGI